MVGRGGSSSVKVEPRYLTRSAKKRFREEPESKDTDSSAQATNTKGSGKRRGRPPKQQQTSELQLKLTDIYQEVKNTKKCVGKSSLVKRSKTTLLDLNEDVLELIVGYLDTESALNLFRVCKTINSRLEGACGFWYQLCSKEKFIDYHALKQSDDIDPEHPLWDYRCHHSKPPPTATPPVRKKRRTNDSSSRGGRGSDDEKVGDQDVKRASPPPRTSYKGELLHLVKMPEAATHWRKVWLRGLQMRRNVVEGRFEMWRLFMTEEGYLPVKKMTQNTSHRELRSAHRKSEYNTAERQLRLSRYWTEDYMIVIQYSEESEINDIFVWEWDECQNPKFKYVHSLYDLYPEGLSPMSFFLWKNYLVLAPNIEPHANGGNQKPLIRVHDLTSPQMELVSGCDMPENDRFGLGADVDLQRMRELAQTAGEEDTTHLHKMGDFAVTLVRVPEFTLFVFSLPDSKLIRQMKLSFPHVPRPMEEFKLEQRFLTRKNVIYFVFSHDGAQPDFPDLGRWHRCEGRLVMVDFESLLSAAAEATASAANDGIKVPKSQIDGEIEMRLCDGVCFDRYPLEKMALVGPSRLACLSQLGDIHLLELKEEKINPIQLMPPAELRRRRARPWRRKLIKASETSVVRGLKLVECQIIPAPGKVMINNSQMHATASPLNVDCEEPAIITARDGEQILVLRHFQDNHRRIHAYDTRDGHEVFSIDLDKETGVTASGEPKFKLSNQSNCLSVDMDGNFLCVSDTHQVLIWNSKTGRFVRQIGIPEHYAKREEDPEAPWQGHTDFAFAEDGLVIVHNRRNFPIAADILLFW